MNTTGYVGSTPHCAETVCDRLPGTFTTLWQDWSEQLVTTCKSLQPADTPHLWYRLPVYRFFLSAGIAGENAWLGISFPSANSAGQLALFCTARNLEPGWSAAQALRAHANYFEHLEQALQSLFATTHDISQLTTTVTETDLKTGTPQLPGSEQFIRQSAEPSLAIRLGDENDLWESACNAALQASCSAHSVWTTSALSHSAPETLLLEGMPSVSCCESMFTGYFNNHHWTHQPNTNDTIRELNCLSPDALTLAQNLTVDDEDTQPSAHRTPEEPATDALSGAATQSEWPLSKAPGNH